MIEINYLKWTAQLERSNLLVEQTYCSKFPITLFGLKILIIFWDATIILASRFNCPVFGRFQEKTFQSDKIRKNAVIIIFWNWRDLKAYKRSFLYVVCLYIDIINSEYICRWRCCFVEFVNFLFCHVCFIFLWVYFTFFTRISDSSPRICI